MGSLLVVDGSESIEGPLLQSDRPVDLTRADRVFGKRSMDPLVTAVLGRLASCDALRSNAELDPLQRQRTDAVNRRKRRAVIGADDVRKPEFDGRDLGYFSAGELVWTSQRSRKRL